MEIYRERAYLVSTITHLWPSWFVVDSEGEEGFSMILYIASPCGQLSWHIADTDLDLFGHIEIGSGAWDGHTTEEKYQRLINAAQTLDEYEEDDILSLAARVLAAGPPIDPTP